MLSWIFFFATRSSKSSVMMHRWNHGIWNYLNWFYIAEYKWRKTSYLLSETQGQSCKRLLAVSYLVDCVSFSKNSIRYSNWSFFIFEMTQRSLIMYFSKIFLDDNTVSPDRPIWQCCFKYFIQHIVKSRFVLDQWIYILVFKSCWWFLFQVFRV